MATDNLTASRRGMLGLLAAAPAALAIPALAAAPTITERVYAFQQWTIDLDHSPLANEKEWERWEVFAGKLYADVEALPRTPQNAPLRARVIWLIHGRDLSDMAGSNADRLMRQMIESLL